MLKRKCPMRSTISHSNRRARRSNPGAPQPRTWLWPELEVVERWARSELGRVREGEVFYQFVEPERDVDPQRTDVEISLPEGVESPDEAGNEQ